MCVCVPAYLRVQGFLYGCMHVLCVHISRGMGSSLKAWHRFKGGVMTRKREPTVPKATCCSLAPASWRGGPVSSCEHLHSVCTDNSDYFDDLAGLGRSREPLMEMSFICSAGGASWRKRCRQSRKEKKTPSQGAKKPSEQNPRPDDRDVAGHSPKRCPPHVHVKVGGSEKGGGTKTMTSDKTSARSDKAESISSLVMGSCAGHRKTKLPLGYESKIFKNNKTHKYQLQRRQ